MKSAAYMRPGGSLGPRSLAGPSLRCGRARLEGHLQPTLVQMALGWYNDATQIKNMNGSNGEFRLPVDKGKL